MTSRIASLQTGFDAMWNLESGLAEIVGLMFRLCTVIWGN